MRWFGAWARNRRLRASIRRCQGLLGPELRRDYGAANAYTPGQITHAMQRVKLPAGDCECACAAFMTEADFLTAHPAPRQSYAHHRDARQRYAITRGASRFEPAAENADATAGATPSSWF